MFCFLFLYLKYVLLCVNFTIKWSFTVESLKEYMLLKSTVIDIMGDLILIVLFASFFFL